MMPFTSSGLPEPAVPTMTPDEFMQSAIDMPLSPLSTFLNTAGGAFLHTPVTGTAIREGLLLPSRAPTAPDSLPMRVPGLPTMQDGLNSNPLHPGALDQQFHPLTPDLTPRVQTESDQSFQQRRSDAGAISEEQYKASPYYRANIPFDAGMTQDRAAALAQYSDAQKVRDFYAQKRPIAAFLGGLAGSAGDVVNYIPIGGEAVGAFAAARGLGKFGGAVLGASTDAMLNTAAFGAATLPDRQSLGDDVTWQSTISDIAMAGLVGAAFGSLHGAFRARSEGRAADIVGRLATVQRMQESRIALNEAIDGLVNGEDIHLSPNGLAAVDNAVPQVARVVDEPAQSGALDALRTGMAREDIAHQNSIDFGFEPGPRGAFESAVSQIPPEVRDQYLAHGVSATRGGSREDAVAGILRDRPDSLQAGPLAPTSEERTTGIASTRTDAPYILLYDKNKPMSQGPDFVVVNSPDLKNVEAGRTAFGDRVIAPSEMAEALTNGRPMSAAGARRPSVSTAAEGARVSAANGVPRAEPIPTGVEPAAARVSKPEDIRALAEQHGVDPTTGAFAEQGDLQQVRKEGRLTADDEAALSAADETSDIGDAFANAIDAAVRCII